MSSSASPYSGYAWPSAEEAHRVAHVLTRLHGARTRDSKSSTKRDLLDCLVQTILSQNTTDTNSHRTFKQLKAEYPSWDAVHSAPVEELEECIRSAGLAQTKSRRIKDILSALQAKRGEISLEYLRDWPNEKIHREVTQFKGVGAKTISCLLLFGLERDDLAVDTHVFRLAQRAGWVPPKQALSSYNAALKQAKKAATKDSPTAELKPWPPLTRETVYKHLNSVVPDQLKYELHLLLIQHGKTLCRAAGCVLSKGKASSPSIRLKDGSGSPAKVHSTAACPICTAPLGELSLKQKRAGQVQEAITTLIPTASLHFAPKSRGMKPVKDEPADEAPGLTASSRSQTTPIQIKSEPDADPTFVQVKTEPASEPAVTALNPSQPSSSSEPPPTSQAAGRRQRQQKRRAATESGNGVRDHNLAHKRLRHTRSANKGW